MSKAHTKIALTNRGSVDSASYIATSWIAGGQLSPKLSMLDVQIALQGTDAIFYVVWSENSDGSSPFATSALNAGGTLKASLLYGFSHTGLASVFWNYQLSATTTVELLHVVEQFDW